MSDEEKSASDPQDHDFDRIRGARVVAGVYAPLIRRRKEKESKESCVITFPSRTIGYSVKRNNNFKHCNCKSSNCLKLYCDCFSCGSYCNADCCCVDCRNNDAEKHREGRNNAIMSFLELDPNSFRPVTTLQTPQSTLKIPMTTDNGKEVVALAFGVARQKRKDLVNTLAASGNKRGRRDLNGAGGSAEKHQEDFESQTKIVKDTFAEVQKKLLNQGKTSGDPGDQDLSMSSLLIQLVRKDLCTLAECMNRVDDNTTSQSETKIIQNEDWKYDEAAALLCDEALVPTTTDLLYGDSNENHLEDSLLECNETMTSREGENMNGTRSDRSDTFPDSYSEQSENKESSCPIQLTGNETNASKRDIVKDIALIQGLTRIIRRKALDLTKRRLANQNTGNPDIFSM